MEAGANLSELGRKPGDPSTALCRLMYDLRRTPPENRLLVCVPPDIYAEAVGVLERSGAPRPQSTVHVNAVHAFFCGHWITPETVESLNAPQRAD